MSRPAPVSAYNSSLFVPPAKGGGMEIFMKYTQDNGKIKLCETDNMDHLVRLTQALNENNILYETRLKKRTFINNLFFLIFYHTFASGIDHKNETTCIYVLEKDFDAAKKAIVNYRETVRKSL